MQAWASWMPAAAATSYRTLQVVFHTQLAEQPNPNISIKLESDRKKIKHGGRASLCNRSNVTCRSPLSFSLSLCRETIVGIFNPRLPFSLSSVHYRSPTLSISPAQIHPQPTHRVQKSECHSLPRLWESWVFHQRCCSP